MAGRFQRQRGRGATGKRGTCGADGSSVIPIWGPTGTSRNAADRGARCLSSFVVLAVRESVFLFVLSRSWRGIWCLPVNLYDLWNCGALGGFSTPPSSGDCAVITPCPGLGVYLLEARSKHTSVPIRDEPGCCLTRSGVFVSSAFATECTAPQLGQKLQPPSPCWCKTGMATQKHLKPIRNPLNLWMGRAERLKGH